MRSHCPLQTKPTENKAPRNDVSGQQVPLTSFLGRIVSAKLLGGVRGGASGISHFWVVSSDRKNRG